MSEPVDVLVIDDNDLHLQYMKDLLTANGYTSQTLDDSSKAVENVFAVKPRLIILDLMMPRLDGLTVLKRIRDHDEFKDVPIIIYTGKSYPIDEKKAYNFGANSYIVKPVKGSVIIEEVRKYL
ncbi:MAG: response regulator [Calditrichales bacterium]|nr:MAG: response regulator [Calditrichales bacterium]